MNRIDPSAEAVLDLNFQFLVDIDAARLELFEDPTPKRSEHARRLLSMVGAMRAAAARVRTLETARPEIRELAGAALDDIAMHSYSLSIALSRHGCRRAI